MKMTKALAACVILMMAFTSCHQPNVFETILHKASLKNDKKLLAVFFVNPECPITQKYTKTLNELTAKYAGSAHFVGVVPGTNFTDQQIADFKKEYALQMPLIKDEQYLLAKKLTAKVYPQVFLLNEKGEVLYNGKIDNWYEVVGIPRADITEHYLIDALNASIAGNTISTKRTEPIGCFMSYN